MFGDPLLDLYKELKSHCDSELGTTHFTHAETLHVGHLGTIDTLPDIISVRLALCILHVLD